jgi:hypothetical protein
MGRLFATGNQGLRMRNKGREGRCIAEKDGAHL